MNDPFYKQVKVIEDKIENYAVYKEKLLKIDYSSMISNPDEIQKQMKELPEKGDEIDAEIKKCDEILAEQKEKKDPEFSDFDNKDNNVANLKQKSKEECTITEEDMKKMMENIMQKLMKNYN